MTIGNNEQNITNRLNRIPLAGELGEAKINLFTPFRLGGSKLIFFAPLGAGVNEENQLIWV